MLLHPQELAPGAEPPKPNRARLPREPSGPGLCSSRSWQGPAAPPGCPDRPGPPSFRDGRRRASPCSRPPRLSLTNTCHRQEGREEPPGKRGGQGPLGLTPLPSLVVWGPWANDSCSRTQIGSPANGNNRTYSVRRANAQNTVPGAEQTPPAGGT